MRLIAFIFASLLASAPAMAQSWKEYTYPSLSFGVSFPAEPTVETKAYQTPDGSSAEARVYSVTQPSSVLKMTIVDLSSKDMEEKTIIDHAIKTLTQDGEVKVNIPHRISRVYGRQLSITGRDGSHDSVAVFFHRQHLYQIEGLALPNGPDGTADAIRFQQSLIFTNGAANRTIFEPVIQIVDRVFFGSGG
jgi:hypothetical protein